MRFLKTLRKADIEQRQTSNDRKEQSVGVKNGDGRPNEPAGALAEGNLVIGRPVAPVSTNESAKVETPAVAYSTTNDAVVSGAFPVADKGIEPVSYVVQTSAINQHIIAITEPNSSFTEEYRVLRTQILHSSQKERVRSIVVSSLVPSEGKSITALNIAWLMAQTDGKKALIIDADMRRPSIAKYLSINPKVGLSHILAGKAAFKNSLIRLEPSGLCFLPAGEIREDISEFLSGDGFRDMLQEATEYFDFVIVDTPPISLFSDSALMTNIADKALLVIRTNQVRYNDVGRVLETFPKEKILGSVLNDSHESLLHGGYYDYSSYYRKAGE